MSPGGNTHSRYTPRTSILSHVSQTLSHLVRQNSVTLVTNFVTRKCLRDRNPVCLRNSKINTSLWDYVLLKMSWGQVTVLVTETRTRCVSALRKTNRCRAQSARCLFSFLGLPKPLMQHIITQSIV